MRKCAGLVLAQGSSDLIYGELGPGLAITHYGNARSDPNYLTR
jgi:hypothetical protein